MSLGDKPKALGKDLKSNQRGGFFSVSRENTVTGVIKK
jgi:hypothetical protein